MGLMMLEVLWLYKFSVVNGFTEIKIHLNEKNTLSDHDRIHGHRNLNETERFGIALYQNFNTSKIYKITVVCKLESRGMGL